MENKAAPESTATARATVSQKRAGRSARGEILSAGQKGRANQPFLSEVTKQVSCRMAMLPATIRSKAIFGIHPVI